MWLMKFFSLKHNQTLSQLVGQQLQRHRPMLEMVQSLKVRALLLMSHLLLDKEAQRAEGEDQHLLKQEEVVVKKDP